MARGQARLELLRSVHTYATSLVVLHESLSEHHAPPCLLLRWLQDASSVFHIDDLFQIDVHFMEQVPRQDDLLDLPL